MLGRVFGRFVGACGEDYEGKSNNQDKDGAHCGEHFFSVMSVIVIWE
jgi:hypothetical protein